ncbi:MAG: hypothetical protein AAFU67_19485, partial [Bacteroidota bacterium]
MTRTRAGATSVSHSVCPTCHKDVNSHDSAILCEGCDGWFHGPCVSMTKAEVDILGRVKGCHWFCAKCDVTFASSASITSQTDKLNNIVTQIESLVSQSQSPPVNSGPANNP